MHIVRGCTCDVDKRLIWTETGTAQYSHCGFACPDSSKEHDPCRHGPYMDTGSLAVGQSSYHLLIKHHYWHRTNRVSVRLRVHYHITTPSCSDLLARASKLRQVTEGTRKVAGLSIVRPHDTTCSLTPHRSDCMHAFSRGGPPCSVRRSCV